MFEHAQDKTVRRRMEIVCARGKFKKLNHKQKNEGNLFGIFLFFLDSIRKKSKSVFCRKHLDEKLKTAR